MELCLLGEVIGEADNNLTVACLSKGSRTLFAKGTAGLDNVDTLGGQIACNLAGNVHRGNADNLRFAASNLRSVDLGIVAAAHDEVGKLHLVSPLDRPIEKDASHL